MKNLKKVLALVLVFASLFGLATMASATKSDDYSDAESITHVEAVDVMSTIGVFDGISGSFSGSSILTREQAAKIITYMILGKEQADALVASVAPYTDVARDRWSAGSIAYCKNEGILAGVGNGRFDPNGKLTGVAFAKMCLVALGYDPNIEVLTGPQWAVNTSKLAIASAGITANLSQASLADEMSREDACQMAFNTIKADLVDYEDRGMSVTVNNGNGNDIVISGNPSKAKPISYDTAKVDEKNSIGNIKQDENTDKRGVLQFGERYFPKLILDDKDSDSFGRPANTWTYKTEEIGTYRRNDWLVQSWTAKATKGEMYNAIGSSAYNWLKATKDPTTLTSHVDGCYISDKDTDTIHRTIDNYFEKNSSKTAGIPSVKDNGYLNMETGNGVLTELYMNEDGDVWVSMINTYLVKASADYNSTKESVSIEAIAFDDETDETDDKGQSTGYVAMGTSFLPTEISSDDFDVTGVKEGDYLLLTVSNINDFSKNKDTKIETVTYATVQKGTVTEYTDNTNVVMDGTKYSYNKILKGSQTGTQFAINSEATLVLDTYGYIMHVDDSVDSSKYVYIDQFATGDRLNTDAIADAYFTDGTNEHISVSKVAGEKDGNTIGGVGNTTRTGWYIFTGSTGSKYTLEDTKYQEKKTGDVTSVKDVELIKSGTIKFMGSSKGIGTGDAKAVKGTDKTIFVVKTDDSVNAYTGIAKVPSVTLTGKAGAKVKVVWLQDKDSKEAKYVFIDVSKDPDAVDEGTSAADYMFTLHTNNKTTHVDGFNYQMYTVVIDGKIEDRWVNTEIDNLEEGRYYYSVKEDTHGRIKSAKEVGKDGNNERRFRAAMGEGQSEAAGYLDYKAKAAAKFNGYVFGSDTEIKRSGSNLTIGALAAAYNISSDTALDKSDLITNEKSSLNVVIDGKCEKLLKDTGADYEVYLNMNVSQLVGLLGKQKLSGRVYLVTTEKDGDVVESLWIYVEKAADIK